MDQSWCVVHFCDLLFASNVWQSLEADMFKIVAGESEATAHKKRNSVEESVMLFEPATYPRRNSEQCRLRHEICISSYRDAFGVALKLSVLAQPHIMTFGNF
jgi:hypothetical protein